ncbi:MAG TPA: nicotinate-nucleotide--dimethylbenzimidazole phosphoribosyltransferase [Dokdonella sp.]|jgi:nicotinate-nucleotide--dimethylbenzimidazole phosphoribosyltransferase|nr:nicotinate-nucleotide--dimethylbenzimidazole phosphoribosyltransferase [Dokdonella sp.]
MTTSTLISLDEANRAIAAKTKPLGALGQLEDVAVRLALLQQTLTPVVDRARVCVFAGDHGVTDEGVSAYPRAVTAEMMKNFDRGGAAINVITASLGVGVDVIDVGVDCDDQRAAQRMPRVRRGSRNMVLEPAMTEGELASALALGADAARAAHDDGIQALGLGEMGIGNTTAAAALLSALSGRAPSETVGRGTGVDDEGLERKRNAVQRALTRHADRPAGARETLRCLGGLEIAAIAGAALEASRAGVAVVADGFISTVGVLAALHIAAGESEQRLGELTPALFFAHRSAERGHRLALEMCGAFAGCDARPLLDLGLRLGEGSGAALAMPVLRAAAAVMRDMATFASANVSAGEHAAEHAE